MKISKLFHWLYFTVMMLPVFLIPIFAIYTRNDNYSSNIQVQVEKEQVVDFNQRININYTSDAQIDVLTDHSVMVNGSPFFKVLSTTPVISGHSYLLKYTSDYSISASYAFVYLRSFTPSNFGLSNRGTSSYSTIVTAQSSEAVLVVTTYSDYSFNDFGFAVNLFDLTQMFGVGNEPTVEEFDGYYDNFYNYTLTDKQLLNIGTITYNDTDIGSQFIYTLYNQVDKYFNFDNVFNFGDLYTWLNTNFFSGNAPLGFFIFWHFLIYWLLVSILWLLFDVLIYVPQLVHRWLDKAAID